MHNPDICFWDESPHMWVMMPSGWQQSTVLALRLKQAHLKTHETFVLICNIFIQWKHNIHYFLYSHWCNALALFMHNSWITFLSAWKNRLNFIILNYIILSCGWYYVQIYGLTLIPTWISYYIHYKVWEEIIYSFPNSTEQPLKFGNG